MALVIPQKYIEIKTVIEQHATEPITLTDLANHAGVSAPYLSRRFEQLFQIAPIEYLIQLRLRRTLMLLRTTTLSIIEISVLVGYEDPFYFSRLVRKRFGKAPRALRQELRQLTDDEFTLFLDNCFTNQGQIWLPILEQDFSHEVALDPRWQVYRSHELVNHHPIPAPERVSIERGILRLLPEARRTALCWEAVAPEEIKMEVVAVNTSHGGLNLGLSISGDTWHGYRLRLIGYTHLELEIETSGYQEVLYSCPMHLAPGAPSYHIAFWRSEDTLYAEIDGERLLEYKDPLPLYGSRHHSMGISRYYHNGSADISRISLYTKKVVGIVDALDPGRRALANGRTDEAHAWFDRIAHEGASDNTTQLTAQYLSALTLPDSDEAKEKDLQAIIANATHPFRVHALQRLIVLYLDTGQFDRIAAYAPYFNVPGIPLEYFRRINDQYSQLLRRVPEERYAEILASLRQFPFNRLTLEGIPLTTLAPLSGLPLREIKINATRVSDLSPLHTMALTSVSVRGCPLPNISGLQGLPLTALWCGDLALTDISPLSGMPLETLDCSYNLLADLSPLSTISSLSSLSANYNQIQHLSPLHGLPLLMLACTHNAINNLAPLTGMPLEHLDITHNRVTNLQPLKGQPLQQLYCGENQILTLLPLHGMALSILDCHANRIVDLNPLRGMPLYKLYCQQNSIVDLAPLAGMPLRDFDCQDNRITSLRPLQGAPLYRLSCGGNPITDLTPLRNAPMNYLELGDIPITSENAQVLQQWPLRVLTCSVTNTSAVSCAAHLPQLQYVNGHTPAHALALLDELRIAVTAWRQGDSCPPALRATLQTHATTAYAHVRYLALPLHMTLPDALAFCSWLGGSLISPHTPEAFAALHAYLTHVGKADGENLYLLGLQRSEHGRLRWASGVPFAGHPCLGPSDTAQLSHDDGIASFVLMPEHEKSLWFSINNLDTTQYVVIQWP